MNSPLPVPSQLRWLTFAIAACLAFVGLFASSALAASAPQTINLCVTKSGPDKGVVRFASKCKKGEQAVQVMAGSAQQGVLGVSESSGQARCPGRGPVRPVPRATPGAKGDRDRRRPETARGRTVPLAAAPRATTGDDGAPGAKGERATGAGRWPQGRDRRHRSRGPRATGRGEASVRSNGSGPAGPQGGRARPASRSAGPRRWQNGRRRQRQERPQRPQRRRCPRRRTPAPKATSTSTPRPTTSSARSWPRTGATASP